MEPLTVLFLAFQVLALSTIAVFALLYLIRKVIRGGHGTNSGDNIPPSTVLITSADTALGLQLCTHFAVKGCRVFAGMKDGYDSLPGKLLHSWIRMRESNEEPVRGSIVLLPLDVTREDMLRDATIGMGAHMNAGERGIAAVINTSGSYYRGRVETQEVLQWEQMLKTNILGSLRVAKAFLGFLRPTGGRLIYLGAGNGGEEQVAFNASRVAVEKCVEDLRKELQPCGVSVVILDTSGLPAESLYKSPMPQPSSDTPGAPTTYAADVLSASALQVIDRALWDSQPQLRYQLTSNPSIYNIMLPCRTTRLIFNNASSNVQRV